VFRDEMPQLFPADARQLQIFTLAELIDPIPPLLTGLRPGIPRLRGGEGVLIQAHCHHHAVMGLDADRRLFERLGIEARFLEGCCGMAGGFGYEKRHYEVSMACAERVLLPAIREASPEAILLADGFSCREQIAQTTGRRALHLAELLSS
jgi:Fe-S oxidoreductase